LSEKKGMPHKIIIDTNVWISYFINARVDYLIGWIIDHPVEIYTSAELADEIEEVLALNSKRRPLSQ